MIAVEDGSDSDTDVIHTAFGSFSVRDVTGGLSMSLDREHLLGTLRAFVG